MGGAGLFAGNTGYGGGYGGYGGAQYGQAQEVNRLEQASSSFSDCSALDTDCALKLAKQAEQNAGVLFDFRCEMSNAD